MLAKYKDSVTQPITTGLVVQFDTNLTQRVWMIGEDG